MRYIKKLGIIFIIACIMILTIQGRVMAEELSEKEQKIYDILETIDGYIQDTSDGVDIGYGAIVDVAQEQKMKKIALTLIELCEDNGVTLEEYYDLARKVNPHFTDSGNINYRIYQEAKDNPNLEGQVNNSEEASAEKKELENKIEEAMVAARGNWDSISTEELKNIDAMLKEYCQKNPSVWVEGNRMFEYAKELSNILSARQDLGDGYQTATGEYLNNRAEEREDSEEREEASTALLGQSTASANHTPDEIMGEAESFLNQATTSTVSTINGENLESASSTLYNIFLSIGIFLAVAIGMYLGIKFMMSSVEEKAKVKEALIPYIAGCVVIFTAFTIWKIVILLLGNIA